MLSTKKLWTGLLIVAFVAAAGVAAVAQDRDQVRDRDHVFLADEDGEGGNNLSFPVIWGEAESAMSLRGVYGAPVFAGATWLDPDDLTVWYPQQDPLNEWQAGNVVAGDLTGGSPLDISLIDWGDNLEARPWTLNSVVRCETVLYQLLDEPMTAFIMKNLYGHGTDEMWGTTGDTYDSYEATLFTGCARFTIQKLDAEGAEVTWSPSLKAWTGEVAEPVFNGMIGEGGEGPGSYSAEINIPGKVIYGYNWFVRNANQGAGVYRLTFSLDPSCAAGVAFGPGTEIVNFGEEETKKGGKGGKGGKGSSSDGEPSDGSDAGGPPVGGRVGLDHSYNITWIDVTIQAKGGKGGGKR